MAYKVPALEHGPGENNEYLTIELLVRFHLFLPVLAVSKLDFEVWRVIRSATPSTVAIEFQVLIL